MDLFSLFAKTRQAPARRVRQGSFSALQRQTGDGVFWRRKKNDITFDTFCDSLTTISTIGYPRFIFRTKECQEINIKVKERNHPV